MTKEEKETRRKWSGFIDIKKHFATSHCPLYDVILYPRSRKTACAGVPYLKLNAEEVKRLLSQGNYIPTPLSESLFYKKFQTDRKERATG